MTDPIDRAREAVKKVLTEDDTILRSPVATRVATSGLPVLDELTGIGGWPAGYISTLTGDYRHTSQVVRAVEGRFIRLPEYERTGWPRGLFGHAEDYFRHLGHIAHTMLEMAHMGETGPLFVAHGQKCPGLARALVDFMPRLAAFLYKHKDLDLPPVVFVGQNPRYAKALKFYSMLRVHIEASGEAVIWKSKVSKNQLYRAQLLDPVTIPVNPCAEIPLGPMVLSSLPAPSPETEEEEFARWKREMRGMGKSVSFADPRHIFGDQLVGSKGATDPTIDVDDVIMPWEK